MTTEPTVYTFDVRMYATVKVTAPNEAEARKLLYGFGGWDDMGDYSPGVLVTCVYPDDESPSLSEES